MKAQAQAAPIIQKPDQDPLPPVVIKIGGGEEPPDGISITIDSGSVNWTDNTGPIWNEARTVLSGRIHELTLRDGDDDPDPVLCRIHPLTDALTTLTVYFEASQDDIFEIAEVPGKDSSIFMRAKSPKVPFDAKDVKPDGQWATSQATFSSPPVKVEFRQRKIGSNEDLMTFEYLIDSDVTQLNLDYQKS